MDSIKVNDLVVVRGGVTVLDHLTFGVHAGTVTGLLGPSGSGKTTLLRVIVGVQKITSGTVTVLDRPAGVPSLRHDIGYTTQAPSVYVDLTVAENVRYHAVLHGRRRDAVDEAIASVGMSELADRLVGTLSGGQRNRVSLACALVAKPRLLLLDEPTVGLDPVLRRDLWALFALLASEGTTLLVSSHVMDEASRCDRLLLLRDGKLLTDDTPDGLREVTGTHDLDEAFLRLVEHGEVAA
ncbi:MAG TPA: ABC transporter ATP-binding protein [Pseudonocardiaceae bacterium]|jgi:ABC-2 type transport system ATP-binding protein